MKAPTDAPGVNNAEYNQLVRLIAINAWATGLRSPIEALLGYYRDTQSMGNNTTAIDELFDSYAGYFIYEVYCVAMMETLPRRSSILAWVDYIYPETHPFKKDFVYQCAQWLDTVNPNYFYPEKHSRSKDHEVN